VQKEFLVASIYTIGIFTPQLSLDHLGINPEEMLLICQFFLMALANLLEFSYFESSIDKIDEHKSFVQFAGLRTTKVLTIVLVLASFLLNICLLQNLVKHKAKIKKAHEI